MDNIKVTTKTINKLIDYEFIVEAEDGEDFQDYVFKGTNQRVPKGTPIGYEMPSEICDGWVLVLCDDIEFKEF